MGVLDFWFLVNGKELDEMHPVPFILSGGRGADVASICSRLMDCISVEKAGDWCLSSCVVCEHWYKTASTNTHSSNT